MLLQTYLFVVIQLLMSDISKNMLFTHIITIFSQIILHTQIENQYEIFNDFTLTLMTVLESQER